MEWNTLITYWYNTKSSSAQPYTTLNSFSDSDFKVAFKLPLAGSRTSSDLSNQGSFGYYWSSSPRSANSYRARSLYLSPSDVNASNTYYRANGYSVRCFKDSSYTPETLILTFDENGGSLLGASQ